MYEDQRSCSGPLDCVLYPHSELHVWVRHHKGDDIYEKELYTCEPEKFFWFFGWCIRTLNRMFGYAITKETFIYDDDDCFYYHSWRNNVVISFETLSSFLT